jgi:hypothetical protein
MWISKNGQSMSKQERKANPCNDLQKCLAPLNAGSVANYHKYQGILMTEMR